MICCLCELDLPAIVPRLGQRRGLCAFHKAELSRERGDSLEDFKRERENLVWWHGTGIRGE